MIFLPGTNVLRQVIFNRNFEIILEHEDPKRQYRDPIMLVNQSELSTGWEDSDRLVPLFEILILTDDCGNHSYRFTLDCENEFKPSDWKKTGEILRKTLALYEKNAFGTEGRLFFYDSTEKERTAAKNDIIRKKLLLGQKIKDRYKNLMKTLAQMVKEDSFIAKIACQYNLSEKTVSEKLYSTSSGNKTIMMLALKILEDSPEARELGIPDGERLYDEVIARKRLKKLPRYKKTKESERLLVIPKDKYGSK